MAKNTHKLNIIRRKWISNVYKLIFFDHIIVYGKFPIQMINIGFNKQTHFNG